MSDFIILHDAGGDELIVNVNQIRAVCLAQRVSNGIPLAGKRLAISLGEQAGAMPYLRIVHEKDAPGFLAFMRERATTCPPVEPWAEEGKPEPGPEDDASGQSRIIAP